MARIVTAEEIEAKKTPKGAWTRAQLAEWGVPWPPPRGWREALVKGLDPDTYLFNGLSQLPEHSKSRLLILVPYYISQLEMEGKHNMARTFTLILNEYDRLRMKVEAIEGDIE